MPKRKLDFGGEGKNDAMETKLKTRQDKDDSSSRKKAKLTGTPSKKLSGKSKAYEVSKSGIAKSEKKRILKELRKAEFSDLRKLLDKFMQQQEVAPFLEPVDWETLGLPEYPEIIREPMDLGTIRSKLLTGRYKEPDDFAKDMRLVWENAKTFNEAGSPIYDVAQNFQRLFERKYEMLTSERRKVTSRITEKDGFQEERIKLFTKMESLRTCPRTLSLVIEHLERTCPRAIIHDTKEANLLTVDLKMIWEGSVLRKAIKIASPPRKGARRKAVT